MIGAPSRVRKITSSLAALAVLGVGLAGVQQPAAAAPEDGYRLVGSFQAELGCSADWQPDCDAGQLTPAGDGSYQAVFTLPGGSHEFKVLNGAAWGAPEFGAGGATSNAENISLVTGGETALRFSFDPETGRTSIIPTDTVPAPQASDAVAPVRQAGSDEQFYFVMTDRFANGDTTNDGGGLTGDRLVTGFDPTDRGFYNGGDIAGLIDQLDYIDGLGTTAIWLTPSFKNRPVQGTGVNASAGYHGYWVTDFTQIDPHLGTNAELADLIDQAHARGIKVYFDIITNHTADIIDYEEGVYSYVPKSTTPYLDADGNEFDPADYAKANAANGTEDFPALDAATSFPYTPKVSPEQQDVKVPAWLNDPTLYHNRGDSPFNSQVEPDTYGDFNGLDDIMTEHPTVVNGFVDVYQQWVDFGVDGFRIDTVKHVNLEFWEEWSKEVLDYAHAQGKDDFFMFGEIYSNDPNVVSPYVRDTDMSSALDFAFQEYGSAFAAGGSANQLKVLFAQDDYYTTPSKNAQAFPTFLGNHDMGRVGYFVRNGAAPEQNSALAHSLLYLTRGQPVVYYGDEQGLVGSGGGDKSARQSLFATQVAEYANQNLLNGQPAGSVDRFDTDTVLYQHIAELSVLRSSHAALADGAQVEQYVADGPGVYAFSRVDRDEKVEYVVALNSSTTPQSATFTALTGSAGFEGIYGTDATLASQADGGLTVTVPALSAVVLRADAPLPSRADGVDAAFATPLVGEPLKQLQPVSVDLAEEAYTETSFSYRLAGDDDWTFLGTSETGAPRVFHDTSGLADGSLVEYRAVVTDASGNLTQDTTYAVVGTDHGPGSSEVDASERITLPGDHGTAMGCANWAPGCEASALTPRANGTFAREFNVLAGTYSYKVYRGTLINGQWDNDNNWGVGGVLNGSNYSYTHAGGPITYYVDDQKRSATTANGPVVTVAGDFQQSLGALTNYSDSSLATWLTGRDADGNFTLTTSDIPVRTGYKVKAIVGLDWSTSYGDADGQDILFDVTPEAPVVTFTFNPTTNQLTVTTAPLPDGFPEPTAPRDITVSIAGSLNAAMGCPAVWDQTCVAAELTNQAGPVRWQTFSLPAGQYEYKAVINHSWSENYGVAAGQNDGANIALSLAQDAQVTFVYDDDTKFVTHFFDGSPQGRFVVGAGDFQTELGCPAWTPACPAIWLQNWERTDGVYTKVTNRLPAGDYEGKVVVGADWFPGANVAFTVSQDWQPIKFTYNPTTGDVTVGPDQTLGGGGQRAYWIDQSTLALPVDAVPTPGDPNDRTWTLHAAAEGGLSAGDGEIVVPTGATSFPLTLQTDGLTQEQRDRFRHLGGYLALSLGGSVTREQVEQALTGQLLLVQEGPSRIEYATGVQIPGVLDDLYAADVEDRTLGVSWAFGQAVYSLWAPTARSVTLLRWEDGDTAGTPTRTPASRQADGTWTVLGVGAQRGVAYQYEVEVYVPSTGQVETNVVTDPYSVGLALNSTHSIVVDLDDPAYRPALWEDTPAPIVKNPVDRSIYELHVRDFSIDDSSVPEAERGTYLAFAGQGNGVKHLQQLVAAGLNTVHLLPSYDIASIEEDRSLQQKPAGDLASFAPDSPQQQAAVSAVAELDGFNWGYDPYHYFAPEGSYASEGNQEGGNRIAEYRTMVGGLHGTGLQVVLDQVYNHTPVSGQDPKSVLDKVVPGYYYRLTTAGAGSVGTGAGSDVATEHAVAGKLMVDAVVTWARGYKIDGFRFDLMGFHTTQNMRDVRSALDELTLEDDGVDGASIYLYGEGWNFGSDVQDDKRFDQARQGALGGTGIGTFSDRLRDAVRGGSPVDGDSLYEQGFGNGLGTDPNGEPMRKNDPSTASDGSADEIDLLRHQTDLVRLGLAGNLRDYSFVTSSGQVTTGENVDYRGAPAGYAVEPDEIISYVDAHDNMTLYDVLTTKLPVDTSLEDRVRMNTLSLATATFAQTPIFWHAGTDLLRSKSLDHDSYNSGDWFNSVDWTGATNKFGVGLPVASKNEADWPHQGPLLANPAIKPTQASIATATAQAQDLLRLRYSTPLFRLGSAELIKQKVTFPESGADATPGLIVYSVDDTVGADVDPALDGLLVVFNASPDPITETVDVLAGRDYQLSAIQANGGDPVVKQTTWTAGTGTVTVPGRTVAVLVDPTTTTPPYPPTPGTPKIDHVSSGTVTPGGTITIEASGFLPGETVQFWLESNPRLLLAAIADAEGRVRATLTIPADTTPGSHILRLIGLTSGIELTVPIEVLPQAAAPQAPGGGNAALPVTGGFNPLPALGALTLLLVGSLVVMAVRSRRTGLAGPEDRSFLEL